MPSHDEAIGLVNAPPAEVFGYLDDHRRLSAHMSRSSPMMLGSRMAIELDSSAGRAVGSKIRLVGRVLGIPIRVEEVVTEHAPAHRKVWQTIGTPHLLVLSHYTMGFEIAPEGAGCRLRVFIDYGLPERGVSRLLGTLLGRRYARWCVRRMVQDAVARFAHSTKLNPRLTLR
jgi:hypothetical protein